MFLQAITRTNLKISIWLAKLFLLPYLFFFSSRSKTFMSLSIPSSLKNSKKPSDFYKYPSKSFISGLSVVLSFSILRSFESMSMDFWEWFTVASFAVSISRDLVVSSIFFFSFSYYIYFTKVSCLHVKRCLYFALNLLTNSSCSFSASI